MNDLDLCLEVTYVMSTFESHSPLNISEIVRDRGLVQRTTNRKWSMGCHVTDDVTWHRKFKLVTSIRLEPISKNSWRCYMGPRFYIFRNSPSSSTSAESLTFPDADMKGRFSFYIACSSCIGLIRWLFKCKRTELIWRTSTTLEITALKFIIRLINN